MDREFGNMGQLGNGEERHQMETEQDFNEEEEIIFNHFLACKEQVQILVQ